ncbi:MAG TPA: hypothetical protein V6C88_08815 [Chroococcidiopsis sp.]
MRYVSRVCKLGARSPSSYRINSRLTCWLKPLSRRAIALADWLDARLDCLIGAGGQGSLTRFLD